MNEVFKINNEWDKVFPLSDKVNHKKVTFKNHFGITLVADMYEPKNYDGKLPSIAVSGPYGAVKEQASGLYAEEMAERGFLTIAFDPSFTGESGGFPRYMTSYDINVEDFQSAVDYLISLDNVDSEKIGIIGICGWGGMALQTASFDTRFEWTVVSTMYDMSRIAGNGYFDKQDNEEARYQSRVNLNNQRNEDYKTGKLRLLTPVECERINCFPDNWTNTGMTDKKRYFMMGNALVVGIIEKIGQEIEKITEKEN